MTHVNSGHCLTVEEKRTAGKVVLGEFDEEKNETFANEDFLFSSTVQRNELFESTMAPRTKCITLILIPWA